MTQDIFSYSVITLQHLITCGKVIKETATTSAMKQAKKAHAVPTCHYLENISLQSQAANKDMVQHISS